MHRELKWNALVDITIGVPRLSAQRPVQPPQRAKRAADGCNRKFDDGSQQRAKLVFVESRISDDASHAEGVHRVVPRDGDDANAVGHNDVLPLTGDAETGFLEGAHSVLMIDAGDPRHVLRSDLDLADDCALEQFIAGREILLNRVLDVLKCFALGGALRPATRQPGH